MRNLKILFVIQNFYPNDDANSNCVINLAFELIKKNNEIHILCMKNDLSVIDFELFNGIYVHRLEDASVISRKKYYEKWNIMKNNIITRLFNILRLFFIKSYIALEKKYSK